MTQLLRAEAEIDLDAVRTSVELLDRASGDAAVMAVVKADAYGHGMLPCARAALQAGATWLGVAFLSEAIELRTAGVRAPILALISIPGENVIAAISADVDLPASSTQILDDIAAGARFLDRQARVHLKIDTGLSRGGATEAEWSELVTHAAKYASEGFIEIVGIWSHLVWGDQPNHPTTSAQISAFSAALDVADSLGVVPQVRHLANSGAALARPDSHFDLVRPGIAVYGLSPFARQEDAPGLVPAMTLRARVAHVKRVPADSGVSYAHRYRTSQESTVALVPVGYADGIPRAGANTLPLHIGGTTRWISGSVCMDQVIVDCGDDAVAVGDEVVLFGRGDQGEPTATDWAIATDTINYEIVTRLGARVPRRYVGRDS